MAKVHGKGGKALIDADEIAEVESWEGTITPELPEGNVLQSDFKERVPGQVDITGTINCFWDSADSAGQVAMMTACITPALVNLRLYEDSTHYFSVPAYLTGASNVTITDIVRRTYTFASTGTFSYT